ncbi:hypothetical protein [Geodermatophilus sp. URMC 64]
MLQLRSNQAAVCSFGGRAAATRWDTAGSGTTSITDEGSLAVVVMPPRCGRGATVLGR